eukprot:scaffold139534_cov109-Phaeocystis_antarctica.AAC.1
MISSFPESSSSPSTPKSSPPGARTGADHGAVVSVTADLVVRPSRIKELLAGGDIARAVRHLEAAAAAHVASEGAHREVRPHYQLVA